MEHKPISQATKFTLEIELGNDAMHTRHDLARALRTAAEAIRLSLYMERSIMDVNGNTVGQWRID